MSQSVNVLSCVCPNCPNCSGESQDYNAKKICDACSMKDCRVCKLSKQIGIITLKAARQKMVRQNDVLSCRFNWVDSCPYFKEKFKSYYEGLKYQNAKKKKKDIETFLSYRCHFPGECFKIKIGCLVSLSDNGEGLHIQIESCESINTKRKFTVAFNEGQTEIDIPVKPPEIMINIYESYDDSH